MRPPNAPAHFRDRDELTASSSLTREVEAAIADSRALLVLCSPAAAASRWVGAEIALFKRLRPDAPVLAAICSGEPWASELPGREAEECFPLALRRRFDKRGRMGAQRAEPIAADLRPDGDGKTLGKLKLVAGLLGLPLDRLARREERRQRKRLAWLAAASVAGMLLTSGLAIAAADARDEAHDQREAAEGLVEFMLKDLRGKLEPVGRLDVLDSVGARTLAYFETQDRGDLSDVALGQRARALHLIGEIADLRGDLDTALRRFREAERSTGEALARAPNDPQRLFDHAQSVYWMGLVANQRGDARAAEAKYREYQALARRLLATHPANLKWRLESVYADMALGALLQERRAYSRALPVFARALRDSEALVAADGRERSYRAQLFETLGWLADAQAFTGRISDAVATRRRQLAELSHWDPLGRDSALTRTRFVAEYALAELALWRGDVPTGLAHARAADRLAGELVTAEPSNSDFQLNAARAAMRLARALAASGDVGGAAAQTERACDVAESLLAREPSVVLWRTSGLLPCLAQRARLVAAQGGLASALPMARRALSEARAVPNDGPEKRGGLMLAHELTGDVLWSAGHAAEASAHWREALRVTAGTGEESPAQRARRSLILHKLGRGAEARALDAQLTVMGYRDPRYMAGLAGRQGPVL